MSFKSLNQKGFAVIETALIIVVLAALGGTGYYVYHHNKKSSTPKPVSTTINKPVTKPVKPAAPDPNAAYGNCLDQTRANPQTAYLDDKDGSCNACVSTLNQSTFTCDQTKAKYPAPTTFSVALIGGYSKLPDPVAKSAVAAIAKDTFPLIEPPECYGGGKIPGLVTVDKVIDDSYVRIEVAHNCGDPGTQILANNGGTWKVVLAQHIIFKSDLKAHDLPSSLAE